MSLPPSAAVRHQALPLLHPEGGGRRELPGSVGGLPGAPPVVYLPVRSEAVVEVEADQPSPAEFGRFRHRPRVVRVCEDLAVDELPVTS
ncbi:hypothetical protein [Streptomyces chrestomyceticus]|uniref:hypothetical protein n=1 Tax=Streptomyces chrestomyceticus TaxID=68185 RepID=UPI0019D08977|nr:hypothetical protein [Streptomyces chrestomyceticus]